MMRRHLAITLLVLAACGDNIKPATDAAKFSHTEATMVCGDLVTDPGEDCDDGDTKLDTTCDATCHFTCGNGVLDDSVGEACDTAIPLGMPGACPTACDDGDACTTDALSGTGCAAVCVHAAITDPADGDGCCPTGANATTDSDCAATCGNGVVEPGEACDTAIANGVGKCPTSCDDMQSCTTDTLAMPGTCKAACSHAAITTAHNGDGCCPAGANSGNDNDCQASCGNGVVDVAAGETCDTGISTGIGKCPTTCSDGIACTKDVLSNPGTCTAACAFVPITTATNGDGCCPTGANANNDNDCLPKCGNGVKEGTEQCDNGVLNGTAGNVCTAMCKLAPTAFRASDLDLRDPHVFVSFFGCHDVTDMALVGFSVNGEIQKNIQADNDSPPDGKLDLSPVLVFRPLVQTNGSTTAMDFYFADCTAPIGSTMCQPGTTAATALTATSQTSGTCLGPIAGTTHPYAPAITNATGTCFASSSTTITLSLGGIPITLHDARVAATYSGSPATSLVNGLLIGFISETDANNTTIPSSFPLVGGQPLSSLLPGGTGNCSTGDDRDTDAGVKGWWFYLNFPAAKVPWSEP